MDQKLVRFDNIFSVGVFSQYMHNLYEFTTACYVLRYFKGVLSKEL